MSSHIERESVGTRLSDVRVTLGKKHNDSVVEDRPTVDPKILRERIKERLERLASSGEAATDADVAMYFDARSIIEEIKKEREDLARQDAGQFLRDIFEEGRGKEAAGLADDLVRLLKARPKLATLIAGIEHRQKQATKLACELGGVAEDAKPVEKRRVFRDVVQAAVKARLVVQTPTTENVNGECPFKFERVYYALASSEAVVREFYVLLAHCLSSFAASQQQRADEAEQELREQKLLISTEELNAIKYAPGTGSLHDLVSGNADRSIILLPSTDDRRFVAHLVADRHAIVAADNIHVARMIFGRRDHFEAQEFEVVGGTRPDFRSHSSLVEEALDAQWAFEERAAASRKEREEVLAIENPISREELEGGVKGFCPVKVKGWKTKDDTRFHIVALVFEGDGDGKFRLCKATSETKKVAPWLVAQYTEWAPLDAFRRDRRLERLLDLDEAEEDWRVRKAIEAGARVLSNKETVEEFFAPTDGEFVLDFRNRNPKTREETRTVAVVVMKDGAVTALPIGDAERQSKQYTEPVPLGELSGWLAWALRNTARRLTGRIPEALDHRTATAAPTEEQPQAENGSDDEQPVGEVSEASAS